MSQSDKTTKFTNSLIHESSPYLLQHAHNPVNWYPWGQQAFSRAVADNKLVLISIGYSACHWCHVMERECFANQEIADIMNEHFICIKVDREERPDVDQIYMDAVQLMTGSGGWPLNCFTLPDGKPVYGGTYFPPDKWKELLVGLQHAYKQDRQKFKDYAEQLTEGIRMIAPVKVTETSHNFSPDFLSAAMNLWKRNLDSVDGGPDKAPKFPLPNAYQFLLQYAHLSDDISLKEHVFLTLDKMAFGGIFDQIQGGFARYSTDKQWKVPHFEKMLYDNAQMLSLYCDAFQASSNTLYKEVVEDTLKFIEAELMSDEGAFYSALDADTEGTEGKYYVWQVDELKEVLGPLFPICEMYFNISGKAEWEEGNNILLRDKTNAECAAILNIDENELNDKIVRIKSLLLKRRNLRKKPGLDDKILTSWNSLMISAYCDAYYTFGNDAYLDHAWRCQKFIEKNLMSGSSSLFHVYKGGRAYQDGFLEDYSFYLEALLKLYEQTFNKNLILKAKEISDFVISEFFDQSSGMFFFNSNSGEQLIARKQEIQDNVIPSSNSSMAKVLWKLGLYFDEEKYKDIALNMLNNVTEMFERYPSAFSNWMSLYLFQAFPFYEIAIAGKDAVGKTGEFSKVYLPNKLFTGTENEEYLPVLKGKFNEEKTMIYICRDKNCKLPVSDVEEAIKQMC